MSGFHPEGNTLISSVIVFVPLIAAPISTSYDLWTMLGSPYVASSVLNFIYHYREAAIQEDTKSSSIVPASASRMNTQVSSSYLT